MKKLSLTNRLKLVPVYRAHETIKGKINPPGPRRMPLSLYCVQDSIFIPIHVSRRSTL